jgi:mono/diheme cytochrome c family protein
MTTRVALRGLVLAAVVLVWAAAVRAGADEKDAQYARHGRALYVQYCVACHGASGRGDGPAAAALKVPPPDLTNISQKYSGFPTDKIMIWIDGEKAGSAHGTREMPVWGKKFRREGGAGAQLGEVYSLTRYLQTIQK